MEEPGASTVRLSLLSPQLHRALSQPRRDWYRESAHSAQVETHGSADKRMDRYARSRIRRAERICLEGPYGDFDAEGGERFIRVLSQIRPPQDRPLERRLVSIVWFLPLMLTWQEEHIRAEGKDSEQLHRITERVTNLVIEILGVP